MCSVSWSVCLSGGQCVLFRGLSDGPCVQFDGLCVYLVVNVFCFVVCVCCLCVLPGGLNVLFDSIICALGLNKSYCKCNNEKCLIL